MVCPATLSILLAAVSAGGGLSVGYLFVRRRCPAVNLFSRPFSGESRGADSLDSDSKTVLLLDVLSQDDMEDASLLPSLPSSPIRLTEEEYLFLETPKEVAMENPLRTNWDK